MKSTRIMAALVVAVFLIFYAPAYAHCAKQKSAAPSSALSVDARDTLSADADSAIVGASRSAIYLPHLEHKRVALLSNHTGVADGIHTLDRLLSYGVDVVAVFSPEHGFRGTAGAGDHVSDSVDPSTGVPILSLYDGQRKYPSDSAMQAFDVLVVDIQDVGLRYYTYYITMVRLIQACAWHQREVLIFDRPNPNGFYVDGPILDMQYKSGVGYLPIPVVHGMTLGELALMTIGEGWIEDSAHWFSNEHLSVVPCSHYTHQTRYRLPVAPSPNLRSMLAVYLYPSMCYFEATPVSLGRGTDQPFLQYGHPSMPLHSLPIDGVSGAQFTPRSCSSAPRPPEQDMLCKGVDLSRMSEEEAMTRGVDLTFLIDACRSLAVDSAGMFVPSDDAALQPIPFFTPFFEKLIGVGYVREMILSGASAEEIRARWADDVERFITARRPYLLYPE